jgi:hypothetical protein
MWLDRLGECCHQYSIMTKLPISLALALSSTWLTAATDHYVHSFKRNQLTDQFWAEGASFGDFNHDGKNDVVSGPFWYEGPDFKKRHEYRPPPTTSPSNSPAPFKKKQADGTEVEVPGFEGALGTKNAYANNFFAFTHDLNGDGWTDIVIMGFPGAETFWYENPKGKDGHWTQHLALDVTDNESPTFADLTGDGKPELVCSSKGSYGYAEPDWKQPTAPWKFHAISPNKNYHKFTHGLGIGDVNGDRRLDLLEKDGWWEQPASLAGDPVWKFNAHPFAPAGGSSQMYAYDVDGDGDSDIISSLAAHGYGLAWYEQVKENGAISFKAHVIMNKEPGENKYGVKFSQLHAIDLVDMDGDGLKDIVTGKRFWAHGPTGDAEPNAAAVLYWFKLVRGADKSVDFIPYLIDDNSGIGTQVLAADVNGDKLPDVVVGNKKGVFVFTQQKKKVSEADWQKAQPKPHVAAAPVK